MTDVAVDSLCAQGRLGPRRSRSTYFLRQDLSIGAVHKMEVPQGTNPIRPKFSSHALHLRDFPLLRVLPHQHDMRVVTSDAEGSLNLVDVGKGVGAVHVGVQGFSLTGHSGDVDGSHLVAVSVDRPQPPSAQKVSGQLQSVEHRADTSVTGFDRAAQLVVLASVTRQAGFGWLVRLRSQRGLVGVADRPLCLHRQTTEQAENWKVPGSMDDTADSHLAVSWQGRVEQEVPPPYIRFVVVLRNRRVWKRGGGLRRWGESRRQMSNGSIG